MPVSRLCFCRSLGTGYVLFARSPHAATQSGAELFLGMACRRGGAAAAALAQPRPRRGSSRLCDPRKRRSRQDAVYAGENGKSAVGGTLAAAKKRQRHRPAAAGAEKPVQMILLFDAGRQALLCLPFLRALFVAPGRETRAGPRQRRRCEKNRGKSGKRAGPRRSRGRKRSKTQRCGSVAFYGGFCYTESYICM